MTFSEKLRKEIELWHLLQHPFYQQWQRGELSLEVLKDYAQEYYVHVKSFARYISATHSQCEDLSQRQVLLENLNEEEGSLGKPHPELWMDFAQAVGCTSKDVESNLGREGIQNVVETFFSQARQSYAQGLAALYAYEYQVPEVAETKIEGLQEHYGVHSESGLSFFKVHQQADVVHRQACEKLLDNLSENEQDLALSASKKAAKSLWDFLTSVQGEARAC